MKNYVVGFVFDKSMNNVLLLLRYKEPYLHLYNGVGGKVEKSETPFEAMERELEEETGLVLDSKDKMVFLHNTIYPNNISLHAFYIKLNRSDIDFSEIRETVEGVLVWQNIAEHNLLDLTNPTLAGDGNVPYFIYLSRLVESSKV